MAVRLHSKNKAVARLLQSFTLLNQSSGKRHLFACQCSTICLFLMTQCVCFEGANGSIQPNGNTGVSRLGSIRDITHPEVGTQTQRRVEQRVLL